MKITIPSIFVTLVVLAVPAFAAEPEADEMTPMRAHVQAMQDTLDALEEEQDPGKQAELMAQHVQQMREGLQMMDGPMSGGGSQHGMTAMSAEQRMEMMEKRMEMMQGMMGQMMGHMMEQGGQAPESAAPAHEH